MVNGIELFRDAMAGYSDNYIVIGGTACGIMMEGSPVKARPTKDIDMIVVVENLSGEFVEAFWHFIYDGGYSPAKRINKNGEKVYALYRFSNPSHAGYPFMIELLSRHSDILGAPSGFHIEPLPDDEKNRSLSAIMMQDDVYEFTLRHSVMRNGIRVADTAALVILKALAYLNLQDERNAGHSVNSNDIKKHRGDVLKLMAIGDISEPVALPPALYEVLKRFISVIQE